MLLRWSKHFHNASKLLLLILARKNGHTSVELSQDAANTPHVDWQAIRHPQYHLRGSIETRLDIGIYLFIFEAARAKVNYLEVGTHRVLEQNVLWLQVTVNNLALLEQYQRAENLLGETSNNGERKAAE